MRTSSSRNRRVGKALACPPFSNLIPGEMVGTAQGRLCPPYSFETHPPMRTSSSREDDTEGTCSPSLAREIATRVLLKAVSAPAWAARLLSSSDISTLYAPLESSATLPGVAEVRIRAFSGGEIGARPWEKERKRRS